MKRQKLSGEKKESELNSHLQLGVCLTDRLSDCGGHLSADFLLDYRGPQTLWARVDHGARLALPIHFWEDRWCRVFPS